MLSTSVAQEGRAMDTGNCTSTCINIDRHMKRRRGMHIRMSTCTNTYLKSSRALPADVIATNPQVLQDISIDRSIDRDRA